MSTYDYSRPLATAQRLIARFGRVVALQGVSTGPADPSKPLRGPAPPPAPITGIPAAFVQPSSLNTLGFGANIIELFAACSQIALISPIGSHSTFDGMKFLIDYDNSVWAIKHIETLKPGETVILHFIGVARP